LLVFSVFVITVSCLQFDVPNSAMRCLWEDYYVGQVIVGKYSIPPLAHMQMTLSITDPNGHPVWENSDASGDGTFAFTAEMDGNYKFCFRDTRRPGAYGGNTPSRRVSINAEEKQVNVEAEAGAGKHTIRPIEYRLRMMERQTQELEVEFKRYREREARHRDTSESTNTRIPSLSTFTILILLCVGAWQVYYLKNYFRKKKLL